MVGTVGEFCPQVALGKELVMWDDELDIGEALEEHDLECESTDDFSDFGFDSSIADAAAEDTYIDYEE